MLNFLKKLFSHKTTRKIETVGSALQIEAGPYSGALRDTIAAIDAIHKDGILPEIAIKRAKLNAAHGEFRYAHDMNAIEIVVHYSTIHPEITTAHEIGHFLDLKGIDNPANFASEDSDILARWRDAVTSSNAIKRITRIYQSPHGKFAETLPGGKVVEYHADIVYAEYLLDAKEIWARSYAQYVTAKSGNDTLRLQLDKLRDRPYNGIYYAEQWDDTDFQPIMLAIDNAFRHLGWINT